MNSDSNRAEWGKWHPVNLEMRQMLVTARTDLKAVCKRLGIPHNQTVRAFHRASTRGNAGRYREQVTAHLRRLVERKGHNA